MSILDKVKIGNSVQVNLELSKDRLTKETIDAINVSSLGKISDFRITDGKGIGVVLKLSNGKEQWFFEDEIDILDENGNVIKKNKDKKEITNLLINHIESFAITNKILSCNFLYIDESWGNHLKSLGYYEWINSSSVWRSNGEKTFDDFLSRFNSNQRKNIKKERKSINKQDIKVEIFNEDDINQEILKKMHNFYEQHCSRWGVWGSKYLTSTFFETLVDNKKNLLLFSASKHDSNEIFAMSMCVKNQNNLWGRYWGSKEEISNLHFELCYYQPIEWAIKNNIHFFDPGAGGKHKRRRGFFAKSTISLHKWFDKNMENIIYPWLNEVNKQTEKEIEFENNSKPFK